MPIFDLLTGMLISVGLTQEGGLASPSQLGRLGLIVYCAYVLRQKFAIGLAYCSLLYFVLLEGVWFFVHQRIYGIGYGFATSFKIAYFIFVLIMLMNLFFEKKIQPLEFLKKSIQSALIYAGNVIFCLITGLGEKSYYDGLGTKGFIASNNGLSMYLGVFSLISLYAYLKTQHRRDFLIYIFILLGGILVGAKTSLIFALVSLFVLFFHLSAKIKAFVVFVFVFIVTLLWQYLLIAFNAVFYVIIYRFQINDSLFSFFASSRDIFVRNALANYSLDGFWFIRIFTGAGAFITYRNPSQFDQYNKLMETDVFDIYFQYGIIVLALYLIFFAVGMYSAFRSKNKLLMISWVMCLGFSATAGHVIFNGMSIAAVSTLFLLIIFASKEDLKQ